MPTQDQTPVSRSCITCRQRKVKCNKEQPCSACQRSKVDCVFPQRLRLPRGRQGGSRARNVEITRRLNRLEGLVERLGGESALTESLAGGEGGGGGATISAGVAEQNTQSEPPASGNIESSRPRNHEPIVQADGIRYLSGDFWTSLSGEVDGLRQLLNQPSDEEDDCEDTSTPSSNRDKPSPDTLFIFKSNGDICTDLRSLHPTPPQIATLSDIFFLRVDPVFKVLHRPTVQNFMLAASESLDHLTIGEGQEALMFAIYFAAVATLSQEECFSIFHEDKDRLSIRYKFNIEAALTDADFLNSMDLVTLQAFVLYLLCLRCHSRSRSVWTLTSLAIRIAHALDLHRDPADLSFSPFETEMRRRLWGQINVLDIRASEDRGSPPMARGEWSTKMPSNVNDEQLNANSTQKVTEHEAGTEMTFSLICQELSSEFTRSSTHLPHKDADILDRKDQENMIKQCSQRLESKYLVYCDTAIPIFWLCSSIGRVAILKAWLLLQYPLQPQQTATRSEASRESILRTAVSIIELADMVETNESVAQWAWFSATWVQWHPLAVTLAELCVQTSGPLVDRAWAIVDVVLDKWSDRIADSKKGTLWRPIKKLLGKAQTARLHSAPRSQGQAVPVPAIQHRPTPDVGHNYAAAGSLQGGLTQDAVSAVQTYASGQTEGALWYPLQQVGLEEYIPSDLIADMNLDQPIDPIDWGEWDEFIESTWQAGDPTQQSGNMQWTTQLEF